MKRFFVFFLAALLLFSFPASADLPDLSGLSFDELIVLREQLNAAIWSSQDWQEVTVPAGTYQIGVDIPAGHWSLRTVASEHELFNVYYFDKLDRTGTTPGFGSTSAFLELGSPGFSAFGEVNPETLDLDMKDGWYLFLGGAVVFTPYTGKPDFGFKK